MKEGNLYPDYDNNSNIDGVPFILQKLKSDNAEKAVREHE